MFTNRDLRGIKEVQYWSSNVVYEDGGLKAWNLIIRNGEYAHLTRTFVGDIKAHCVKRN